MKIGLIDVDGHNFPNIPLMKLSAWHKLNKIIKGGRLAAFFVAEIIEIFIQMVLTTYTSGSILSIEVKTTAHDKEKKQMENKNVLDIIDDGVSAFKLTMNGVIIYSSWTLSDCFKHAEWMYRVASQELYWKSGRKVESRKEN